MEGTQGGGETAWSRGKVIYEARSVVSEGQTVGDAGHRVVYSARTAPYARHRAASACQPVIYSAHPVDDAGHRVIYLGQTVGYTGHPVIYTARGGNPARVNYLLISPANDRSSGGLSIKAAAHQ